MEWESNSEQGEKRAHTVAASRRLRMNALLAACAFGVVLVVALVVAERSGAFQFRQVREAVEEMSAPATPGAATPRDPYAEAVLVVEQARGEPVGRQASVEIPAELKHYQDRRRFLAVQIAEARDERLSIPHDFAALAALIRQEQLVELPLLGENYLLYGVGFEANDELTHYDAKSDASIPLFAGAEELASVQSDTDAQHAELSAHVQDLRRQLARAGGGAGEQEPRAALQASIAFGEDGLASVRRRRDSLRAFYAAPERRRMLFAEYEVLRGLANDFGGQTYDLSRADSRRAFKVRLLGFVRPATRRIVEELGLVYRQKFQRHLPVTSLIRPEEYQRSLRESGNANAAAFDLPPHATGLAFDIYYGFMNAAEQQFIMEEIARRERDGRIEALRELRNHYHLFVFADGRAPLEASIGKAGAMKKTEPNETTKNETKKSEAKKNETAKSKRVKKGAAKSSR